MMQSDKRQLKSASSLLDFEAANYFKLDPCQLQMFADRSKWINDNTRSFDAAADRARASHHHRPSRIEYRGVDLQPMAPDRRRETSGRADRVDQQRHSAGARSADSPRQYSPTTAGNEGLARQTTRRERSNHDNSGESAAAAGAVRGSAGDRLSATDNSKQTKRQSGGGGGEPGRRPMRAPRRTSPTSHHRRPVCSPDRNDHLTATARQAPVQVSERLAGSSTASTSSLPSISSSPSVSPSLVCPHLSLDDLLDGQQHPPSSKSSRARHKTQTQAQRSPHTIGLCARCRTNAPPNAHSPLSPMYRPSRRSTGAERLASRRADSDSNSNNRLIGRSDSSEPLSLCSSSAHSLPTVTVNDDTPPRPRTSPSPGPTTARPKEAARGPTTSRRLMKRGYSDGAQVGSYVSKSRARHRSDTSSGGGGGVGGGGPSQQRQRQLQQQQQRDDSLDYCLETSELRRMQMSPTLRHSVEFIRTHSIESARVVRVFKLGEPFEKPLRVCITRGEFNSLDHLLDHINTRQLIASGARYLFHMDGQLVYSVHELKHQKSYLVSGARQFDYRAASVVKERLRREQEQADAWRLGSHPHGHSRHLHAGRDNCSARSSQLQLQSQPAHQDFGLDPATGAGSQPATALPVGASASSLERDAAAGEARGKSGPRAAQVRRQQQLAVARSGPRALPNGHSTRNDRGAAMGRGAPGRSAQQARTLRRKPIDGSIAAVPAPTDQRTGGANFDSMEVFFDTGDDQQHADIDLYLDLDDDDDEAQTESKPAPAKQPIITRAKSEMSGLPTKRKKNVTFIDTGRGSSPALAIGGAGQAPPSAMNRPADGGRSAATTNGGDNQADSIKALSTSEIGIQVSDSLEGHLIDLPIALPATVDAQRPISGRSGASRAADRRAVAGRGAVVGRRGSRTRRGGAAGKIVAFSERQLSLDEMSQLTDLDRGDHHSVEAAPPEVRINSIERSSIGSMDNVGAASIDAQSSSNERRRVAPEGDLPANSKPARSGEGDSAQVSSKTSSVADETPADEGGSHHGAKSDWHYPGGREQTATPIERPVSQNAPNESVRARVTTPTPSLSTGGDNNSLTLSYDTSVAISKGDESKADAAAPPPPKRRPPSAAQRKLPPKRIVPVRGVPCEGVDPPESNFRLVWVNGLAINDQYPDNSLASAAQEIRGPDPLSSPPPQPASGSGSPTQQLGQPPVKLLAPNQQQQQQHQLRRLSTIDFKPSERFHNWICHSRLHDELIYPAGALIVLWSRWTDTQRYYSQHTANVTCISLASLDLDLAASAQLGDSTGKVQPAVHLWSLTDLTTLLVFGDELFRARRVISLRLRHSASSGCDIWAAARDDKCLWLYSIRMDSDAVRPKAKQQVNQADATQAPAASGQRDKGARGGTAVMSVAKINKALQAGQLPLLLTNLSEDTYAVNVVKAPATDKSKPREATDKSKPREAEMANLKTDELVVSFGRRHFQVWSIDRRQSVLKAVQSDKKAGKLADLIAKSNCLARLSPSEFLLGDSSGNIALLKINLSSQAAAATSTTKSVIGGLTRSSTATGKLQKYSVETVHLVGPQTGGIKEQQQHQQRPLDSRDPYGNLEREPENRESTVAVTCLARVSGNLFASGDSNCTMRFWKLLRRKDTLTNQFTTVGCSQVSCISLPTDLGFVCTILSAKYDRKQATVEFYVVSTSNAILFGHVKLSSTQDGDANVPADVLANSSLSVVYEGHETSVTGLMADVITDDGITDRSDRETTPNTSVAADAVYFTCSLDCKVCKWNKNKLVWKSMLPSACASMAVHPIGSVLAVGSVDGTVYILDKLSGLLISYFPLTPVRINCLGYASDGSLLAAGCLNGSIFMLPVYERGLKYKKVSIFQSPHPVVSLQFSSDNRYILTSVTHGSYQELILWDLPNFRYMRDNVKSAADKIDWFDSICSGSEDVRATWENANIESSGQAAADTWTDGSGSSSATNARKLMRSSSSKDPKISSQSAAKTPATVINLSCHRLILDRQNRDNRKSTESAHRSDGRTNNFAIASDTHGYLRLFRYPCYNIDQGFYAIRPTSDPMNCCRFLAKPRAGAADKGQELYFVSASLDGTICVWSLD